MDQLISTFSVFISYINNTGNIPQVKFSNNSAISIDNKTSDL